MIYLILFFISFILTYVIKIYAIKKSLIAKVNDRSSHTTPTPHGGGIAIAIAWFIGIIYFYINMQIESNLFYALLMGVVISIVSYFDDLYELSPKLRIVVQSSVAIGAIIVLGGLNTLELGLFSIENQIITNLFAFLMIVWFINLYNFLDGIDGYAGSEALFLAIAGLVLFGGQHFIVLIVSVLGFLIWNWHKAHIFMGDVGSTLLGYNIAVFTIYYSNQESTNLWVWIILFGLFWFDATLTLLRRYKNGEKLSEAHRKHAYQRLTQSGWSHDRVTIYSMVVNIFLFSLVYFVSKNICSCISNIIVAFLIALILLYSLVRLVDKQNKFN